MLDRLQDLFIVHRGLDPNDEDSTADEQAEKLLYFYSRTAGDTNDKVQIMTAVEAMIQLAKTFSSQPLESVMLERKLWALSECEPNIWIVASISNDYTTAAERPETFEVISAETFRSTLKSLYSQMYTLFGPLHRYLTDDDNSGWQCLMEVIKARKLCRKTKYKLDNASNDYQKLLQDQHDGIIRETMNSLFAQSEALVTELRTSFSKYESDLIHYSGLPEYHLPDLRKRLQAFMFWYLSLENINRFSCFTQTRQIASEHMKLRSSSGTIYRLTIKVKQAVPSFAQMSMMISYDHRLLFSDLDSNTTASLCELLQRLESSFLLGQTNLYLRKAMEDFARSVFLESRCEYTTLLSSTSSTVSAEEIKKKVVESIQEQDMKKTQRSGVMTLKGQYISLEKFGIRLPSTALPSSPDSPDNVADRMQQSSVKPDLDTTGEEAEEEVASSNSSSHKKSTPYKRRSTGRNTLENTGLTFMEAVDAGDGNLMAFNRIFAAPSPPPPTPPTPPATAAGAATAKDTALPVQQQEEMQRILLGRLLLIFHGRLTIALVLPETQLTTFMRDEIRSLLTSYRTVLASSLASTSSKVSAEELEAAKVNGMSVRISRLVEKLESTYSANASSNTVNEPATAEEEDDILKLQLLYIAKKVHNVIVSELAKGDQEVETIIRRSVSPIRPVAPSSSNPKSPLGSSMSVNYNMTVGGHQPHTIRGFLQVRSTQQFANNDNNSTSGKDMLMLCFSPSISAVRVYSNEASLQEVGTVAMALDAVLDKYFLNLPRQGIAGMNFIQCLVPQFGLTATRAVQDLWSRLQKQKMSAATNRKSFMCQRISTGQRGGVWVIGKKLLNQEVLVAIVTQCLTVQDVHEVFEQLVQEVQMNAVP